MIPKNTTPVERILAFLDEESAAAENYSASEIEVLPIAEIETRLDELGMGSSLRSDIKGAAVGYVRPSQKVIEALSPDQDGRDDEIERLALEQVTATLNNAGLDFRAGLGRVLALVEATAEYKKEDGATSASHDEKREIFERHFLFGKLRAT